MELRELGGGARKGTWVGKRGKGEEEVGTTGLLLEQGGKAKVRGETGPAKGKGRWRTKENREMEAYRIRLQPLTT